MANKVRLVEEHDGQGYRSDRLPRYEVNMQAQRER